MVTAANRISKLNMTEVVAQARSVGTRGVVVVEEKHWNSALPIVVVVVEAAGAGENVLSRKTTSLLTVGVVMARNVRILEVAVVVEAHSNDAFLLAIVLLEEVAALNDRPEVQAGDVISKKMTSLMIVAVEGMVRGNIQEVREEDVLSTKMTSLMMGAEVEMMEVVEAILLEVGGMVQVMEVLEIIDAMAEET